MSDLWVGRLVVIIASVLGSGAFWSFLRSKDTRRDATTRLLMGMAYDTITTLGVAYIERGWVTKDEYEELRKYFFEPYKSLGGNGVAERIMNEVSRLPFSSHNRYSEIFRNRDHRDLEGWHNNVRIVNDEFADEDSDA